MTTIHPSLSRRRCAFALSFIVASVALAATPGFAQPLAFPGAEGFGAVASGGRGGTVYHVTNLNDSGAGSFRDAVSQPNRTVVFDVGGIITLTSPVVVKSNITIAGQTAPGEGITLYGDRLGLSGVNNLIMRYVRVREGINGDSGTDTISADTGDRMIFDHVSASWGRDETFSFNGSASNITIQDCIIGQGLLLHSAGGLIQTSGGVSIFRTLYTDNYMRNPKVKGVNDFQNNVVYNYGTGGGYIPAGDSAGLSFVNIINNYFIAGPVTQQSPFKTGNQNFNLFHSGNLQDININGVLDGTAVTDASFPTLHLVGTQFNYPAPATLLTADQAFAHITAYAGASLHRDHADLYMLNELASKGTVGAHIFNESEIGGIGTVAGALAPKDTDGDGMPDFWEQAAGTDPLVADNNGDLDGDGYTNLENYINALTVSGVPAATITGVATDTGLVATDSVTSDNTLVLGGTAAPGATVTLSRVDTGAIGTTTADGSGIWTFDYTSTPLADRFYAFIATVGSSVPSRALIVKVDSAAAAAPAITSVVVSPAFTINGTSEPGSAVAVTLVGTGIVGTATTDELGNWSAPYTGLPLAPGAYSFTAAAIDVAGNPGPDSAPYAVDTSVAAPVFTGIVSDSGASSNDGVTNDPSLVFNGTSAPGAIVSLTRAGIGVIGSATADGSGAWTFDYTGTTLPAGVHNFSATASTGGSASPASTPFVVTIDLTRPTVSSIRRQDPTTAATTVSTLVYRVTFAEPVSGVDATDFTLTLASGVTGTISSLTPVSSTVYDVTVTGAAGDGTIRLNTKSSGTGIVDVAGNAMNVAFTAGQTYTLRLPGSGVWISDESGELWSTAADWEDGIVANGAGATADFSSRNLDGDVLVQLDSPRTVGRIVFGDTDFSSPTLWTLGDNGSGSNILTLDGPTPNIHVDAATTTGDTVDVPAANEFPSRLDVVLAGTAGFTKTGVGTIEITKPATITGPLTVTKGIVQIGPGGSLTPSSVFLATSQQLRIAGGTFSTAGDVTWNSGTGTGIIVSAGTANFQRILPSNTRNSFVRVTGGTFTATEISFPRSGDSESQALASGILISGGDSTVGTIGLGTNNSWGAMTISGGRMTVTGPVNVGFQVTSGRGGDVAVSGGEFNVTDASLTGGLILSHNPGTQPNNVSKFTITGGVSNISRIALGFDATSTAGSATVSVTNGELNIGVGGIVKNGTSGMATSITLSSGTLGAIADWSTTHPIVIAGSTDTLALRAGDGSGTPFNITLGGELSGDGGFAKTGLGALTLAAANTFGGSVAIDSGTLVVTGSLAGGGEVDVNAGGILAGNGTIAKNIVLNGGTLSPDGSSSVAAVTVNGGSTLSFHLGASGVSDQLVIGGAFTKGTAGSFPIALNTGAGFAAGNTYTLATFASTDFVASDFTATGFPAGYVAFFSITDTSLQVTIKAVAGLTIGDLKQAYDGTPKSVVVATTPADLNIEITYDGSTTPPTLPGSYDVVATVVDPAYTGSANATLVITITALVRHTPSLNGDIDGSAQILLGESGALNGSAGITGDLLVPGTPNVQLNGTPTYGGTLDADGATSPSNFTITLNSHALLRHVVRRVDPIDMPEVAAPQSPSGTRNVSINNASQSIGDFATLRNLTLNSSAGVRAVPPGVYGAFTANGNGFVLGVAGATEPAIYELQSLTLNSNATVQVVGPVILRVANSVSFNGGSAGATDHPEWLTIEIANGGLALNSGADVRGDVVAPLGTVTLNSGATILGHVSADRLAINGSGLLEEP